MQARPHDLLRLSDLTALRAHDPDAPGWVWRSLHNAPWAVVRRARSRPGHVPLGVRGRARHERYAIDIPAGAVAERVRPEDLRRRLTDLPAGTAPARTAAALAAWLDSLDRAGLRWGPTGSAGFQLATGRTVVTPHSDLDLIVRLDALTAAEPLPAMPSVPGRVDCLVETPEGAVAWADLASGSRLIMLRTPDGPRLVSRTTHSRHAQADRRRTTAPAPTGGTMYR
jgi:phosphoribosyl-dephospho-CoA transferase